MRLKIICLLTALMLIMPVITHARDGDCGYEGGISSGQLDDKWKANTPIEYQEMCFITGEPFVLKGSLFISKSVKQDVITVTHRYDLRNIDRNAVLTRLIIYETKNTKKSNGQIIEETSLSRAPTETIRIGNTTYTLRSYDFTRTRIVDPKPAINYYAGNFRGRKAYQTGNNTNGGTVTIEISGDIYGYDQHWSSIDVQNYSYYIEGDFRRNGTNDKWSGISEVSLSSSTSKKFEYKENEPYQISFEGGYIQKQNNNSILEYKARMPEFDAKGFSTDNILTFQDSLAIETFTRDNRLPVPNLKHIRGHWYERDVNMLYSLEIFKDDEQTFNPRQIFTRAEFAAAIVKAAKEVPPDPTLAARTNTAVTAKGKAPEPVSPFKDVSVKHTLFNEIDSAFKRGLIGGKGDGNFGPNDPLTLADAITVFIRAVGLESLAPNPAPVTTFRDNDQIPHYARNAVYVAHNIGLVAGDNRGYLNPRRFITKDQAAALINRFIQYMCSDIKSDYRRRGI